MTTFDDKAREAVKQKLLWRAIPGRVALARVRLPEESQRNQADFTDPLNAPFWLYLGEAVRPKSLVNVGVGVGAWAATCLRGAATRPDRVLCLQEGQVINHRLALSNLRDLRPRSLVLHRGLAEDREFWGPLHRGGFDLGMVCDEKAGHDRLFALMDMVWGALRLGGVLAVDYCRTNPKVKEAYEGFAKGVGREAYAFSTRYGVGVLTK